MTQTNNQSLAKQEDKQLNQHVQRTLLPAADVYEQADSIQITTDMPGVSKEALDIEVDGETLTVGGAIDFDMPEALTASYAELRGAKYRRQFRLGNEIDTQEISAEIKNGEVTISLPKKASHKPRQIQIKANN